MYSNNFDNLRDRPISVFGKCPNCKQATNLLWAYCGYCGHSLRETNTQICPQCHTSVDKSLIHCTNCGSLLSLGPYSREPQIWDGNIPRVGKPPFTPPIWEPAPSSDTPHINQRLCPNCKIYLNKEQEHCHQCGQFVPDFIGVGDDYRANQTGFSTSHNTSSIIPNDTIRTSSQSRESCVIATACDSDEPTLATFYAFRDEVLLKSRLGQKMVQLYYHYAPPLADLIRSSDWLKTLIRTVILKPLAYGLRTVVLSKSLEKVEV